MSNIKTQIGKIIGKTLNSYHDRVKPKIDELKFKEEYQGRIIDCMVGEVDDNYIETPETDENIVKLEHSKEGVIKIPQIKGKTILVDADGNETDTPAEGCRLVSVGEEEDNKLIILSKNKNLFDGELKRGYALGIEEGFHFGDFYPSENYSSSINYIIVEPNVTYRVNKDRIWVIEYDKHFNPIKFNSGWTTFVFDLNTKYIRFYLNNVNTENVQIEKNENITSYIPPKCHKTEILLNEPLRSLPNGVCDEIVGNQTIRRVGRIILDGTENWNVHPYEKEGFLNVWVDPFKKPENMIMFGSTNCERYLKCNILNVKNNRDLFEELISIHYQPTVKWCYISVSKERMSDINEFKKWLSENPIEILYELEEPIIEELPNGITLQGFDDTTMYIENSITPTVKYGYNTLIPYKQEILNQKEEVETNTLDIEQNIIPYLMDMEFNLMLMEDE